MPSAKKRKIQEVVEDNLVTELQDLDPRLRAVAEEALADTVEVGTGDEVEAETPSKRGRGRPKGARNKRTPTPEGDIPPEERYFFQTRVGPANQQPTSTNSFAALGLLSHEDYLLESRKYKDPHDVEIRYLKKLHARAFPQWQFQLEADFSICLYGWGSKRQLVIDFAEYLCRDAAKQNLSHPKIVMVNAYAQKVSIRYVLNTIATALNASAGEEDPRLVRLVGQPQDMVDTILARLDKAKEPIYILLNSTDHASSPFRTSSAQALLSRLSSHANIRTLMTCDTPTSNILFPSNIRNKYALIFHDATTFAPYDTETNPVDDVNELLGRKGRRVGGSQGISFVLKSLPENARNLYKLLVSEILTLLSDDDVASGQIDPEIMADEEFIDPSMLDLSVTPRKKASRTQAAEDVGIEYRTLYQRASEQFICSSDMNFRFLLKEFQDHQMLTTRKDASGTEMLSVPLGKDEMDTILEALLL